MSSYLRYRGNQASYFFTVNCAQREGNDLLVERISLLRSCFRQVQQRYPFLIDAIVVLPEHLHCIWTLPYGDCDYSKRWSMIKSSFSRGIEPYEERSASRWQKGERGIWQRRFWEHTIRDASDFIRCVQYIHLNPVKHGLVSTASEWPYSSYHRDIQKGSLA